MIRLGLLCSSGGSPVGAALQILRQRGLDIQLAVVTDRPCEAEVLARRLNLSHRRIEFTTREQFSRDAAQWLYDEQRMDFSCLLFSRLVSRELFERAPCFNIHPALLPAFPGLRAIDKAFAAGVRFFGATVHRVDDSMDGGPIVAQIVSPITSGMDIKAMQRLSFAHKTYLLLVLIECMILNSMTSHGIATYGDGHIANPGLNDSELDRLYVAYMKAEGIPWTT